MSTGFDYPQPRGVAASIDRAVARVRKSASVSLAFSGRVESGGIVLSHFDGDVVGPLRGVRLEPGQGLAGPVLGLQRPMAVGEYMTAPVFSHRMDYDEIIRAEQLRSFAAVPVVVGRKAIAVLYASHRAGSFELGRMLDSVAREARALEQEIAVARAVDALLDAPRVASTDLSLVAQQISDPAVRAEIMRIAEGLATTSPPLSTRQRAVTLTARELDVLALLTSGLKNPAIAEALGISAHTVKDHVKNLLAKLQVSNRMEAVTIARRKA